MACASCGWRPIHRSCSPFWGGAGLGIVMGSLLMGTSPMSGASPLALGVVIVGLVLTGLAMSVCHPLYHRLLGTQERHND